MKTGFVAASALVGSVAAGAHQAHNPFHQRRGEYADNQICTVYTTVYVTALPSIVPNATEYVVPSPVPETSAPCTEEEYSTPAAVSSSIWVAPSPSSVYVAPSPPASSEYPILSWSKSAYVPAPAPSSSEKPYVPVPAPSSEKPYVSVPAPSSEKPYVPSVPAYTPSAPAYTPVVPKPSKPVESHKPKPSKPAHGGGQYSGNITPNGQKWAITYTPYAQNGDCKSAGEVQSDIAKIAGLGYTTIRSYSTDCGVFENVVPACQKHGLKVIYGIFLDAAKGPNSEGANEQLEEIINKAPKDSIAMLVVGNEYIFGHGGSASELAPYVKSCKEKLVAAGFSSDIPVTTTEPVGTWEQYGETLCDVIDVFAVQVHPFFDGGISAENAGDFAQKQLEQAAKVCPEAASRGKYITEIGWPKGGETNGAAVPSPSEQKKAIESIIEAVGEVACIFSFQDDEWKDAGAFGVERNFGCADILP